MPWRRLSKGTLKTLSDAALDRTLSTMPRFFLTGDGHGHPPFEWTNACPRLQTHFKNLMNQGKLCAHVEEFQDQVTDRSIPLELCQLYDQGRVFGWELEIYRDLLPIMGAYYEIAPVIEATDDEDVIFPLIGQIVDLDRRMSRVRERLSEIGNPASLDRLGLESARYTKYFEGLKQRPKNRDRALEQAYARFLREYWAEADKLRTVVNPSIGAKIHKKIIEYSECTHIISCGNEHISDNPLYNYIPLSDGVEGVVDEDDCRDLRRPKKPPVQKPSGGFSGFFGWFWKG